MAKLTGTNPDQVPTNADLGTMAYQDKDNVNVGSFTSNGIDDNATSTAMTLDSSGNLLVGTTSYNSDVQGVGIGADAFFYVARQRNTANTSQVATFNRKGTDGNITLFQKDGTTVGSIGSRSGIVLTVGSSSYSGLDFGSPSISPMNANTRVDNTIDLGSSSHRFKDLYLSGGVYLGGTGAANKLDDYEEGTWTPVIYGTTTAGTFTPATNNGGFYIKIGRQVTCWLNATGSLSGAAGNMQVSGLPFTVAGNVEANGKNATFSSGSLQYWDGVGKQVMGPLTSPNTLYIYFHTYDTNSSSGVNPAVVNGNHNLHAFVTYITG